MIILFAKVAIKSLSTKKNGKKSTKKTNRQLL
jgi:hypothetical protein